MYFVVRFEVSKTRAIIPVNWVLGINEQWEKFINLSMNHNQKFVCFYSERDEIMRDLNFVPDFDNLEFVEFPNEGLYDIKLIFYAGEYPFTKSYIFLNLSFIFIFLIEKICYSIFRYI